MTKKLYKVNIIILIYYAYYFYIFIYIEIFLIFFYDFSLKLETPNKRTHEKATINALHVHANNREMVQNVDGNMDKQIAHGDKEFVQGK